MNPSLQRLGQFLRSPRFPIFMIVFVDVLGLGITIPVLPLFAQGVLQATATQVSALTSVYFLAQFFAAPWLGRLSDRVGRRPVLILSQVGTFAALLLTGLAPTLFLLYAARIIDGLTGGNVSVAQAYMSDISDERNRAQGLGVVNASFGLGFVFGPAMGGLLSAQFGPRVPFFVAAGVSFGTILLSTFLLKESLPPERRRHEQMAGSSAARAGSLELLRVPAVAILMAVAFGSQLAFFAFQSVHVLWAEKVVLLGYPDQTVQFAVGGVLAFVGVFSIATQFWWIGPLVQRFGEKRLLLGGRFATGLALTTLALAPLVPVWVISIPFVAVGNGVSLPSLIALITYAAPPGKRGQAIGLQQSFSAAGSFFGPLLSGWLFDHVQPGAAIGSAGLLTIATVAIGLAILRVPLERPQLTPSGPDAAQVPG